MTRKLPAMLAFALTSLPALALADVDVQFSAGVKQALGGDPGATAQETRLEDALEHALDGIADGSVRIRNGEVPEGTTAERMRDLAKRLADADQTIRILCREEALALGETDPVMARLYEQSAPAMFGGGAATHGDFDAAGNPRPGGTMIIVIECARLVNGWFRPPVEGAETMLHVLGHELVHGAGESNVHGGGEGDEPYYDAFGDLIQRVTLRMARKNAKQPRKKAPQRTSEKSETGGSKVPPCEDE